ncbi:MAG: FAD-dependent oxidoreductase, partial [bacterium]
MSETSEFSASIAIIGGATAGAEAAERLRAAGALCVVFEQNDRPYGKVEDGLPMWHEALRNKEYASIDKKLHQPGVQFVPATGIGRDLTFDELLEDWGFDLILLANGAWRDRPLSVTGADAYINRGLVYQNPFIYWFNHYRETGYHGPTYQVEDGAIVVGGGLASIDVAKLIQLELTLAALAERGIDQNLIEM